MKKSLQLFVMFLLFAGTAALGGTKFAVASGNWTASTTWSLTRGGAPGAVAPTATDTVTIPSPFMVTLDGSGKPCYNLIVEAGAAFIGNAMNPTNSQVYVRVNGDSVVNDGIIGYDPAKGPDSVTALGFEAYAAGKTLTFKGSGISKISRIRGGNNLSNTTVVIDQDMTLTYTGSTGTGGVAWYGNQGTGAGGKLVINAGRTLSLLDQGYIGTASSVDADGNSATIQVDGSLMMKGANCTMSLRPATGAVVSLIVNGTVEIGRTLKPTGTPAGGGNTSTITVNAGGVLKVGTGGLGVTYFDSPAQTVTGAGSFQFAGGTMQIGAAAGLDPVNGPIRTTTRSFATTGGYLYLSNAPQVTGPDLPSTVGSLSVADTNSTLTLSQSVTVDTALAVNYGKVLLGGNTLTLKGTASNNAGAFVDGNVNVVLSVIGTKTWTVGEGVDALPLKAYVSSISGTDTVIASIAKRSVTPPAAAVTYMSKVFDRYYHLTRKVALAKAGVDSLVLSYTDADVAGAGAAEDSLRVFISGGKGWASVPVVRRDTAANLIVAGPVKYLGDLVIAGADPVSPVFSVGTGNVPNEAAHFATLKAAADSLNASAVNADMLFYITSDLTEPANVAIGPVTNGHTVTFKPYTGVTSKITLTQTTDNSGLSGGVIIGVKNTTTGSSLNYGLTLADSVERIVIDGSNTPGGTTRDLTIATAAGTHTNTNPVKIFGNANFITVKNVIITAGQNVSYGLPIVVRNSTLAGAAGNYVPDNVTIENCDITSAFGTAGQGMAVINSGTPTVFPTNIVIRNNKITGTTRGIFLMYAGDTEIYGNEVLVNNPNSGFYSWGISAITIGAPTNKVNIYNNKITKLLTANTSTGSFGIIGIFINTQGTYNVYNNMVSGLTLPNGFQGIAAGIGVSVGSINGFSANIYNNSVVMPDGANTAGATAPIMTAFYLNVTGASGTRVVDVKDNIFANYEKDYLTHAFYWADSNKTAFTFSSNNNVLYTAGGAGKVARRGGYPNGDLATLADWVTSTAQDTNSVAGDPQFISASDLHIKADAKPTSSASNAGTPLALVTKDIDGDTRDAVKPDIGADEFTAVVKNPGFALTPAVLGFRNVPANTPTSKDVTVKNTGNDSLFISNVVSTDPAFTVTPTAARLDTGASVKFTVTYTAATPAMKNALVVFTSNAAEVSDTLRVSGTTLNVVTIGDARKDLNGDFIADRSVTKDTVMIYGVINSPNFGTSYPQLANFVQDSTGGLEIFGYTLPDPPLVPGDSVCVTGFVAQYKGLVELTPLSMDSVNFRVIKHNAALTPRKLTLHQFMLNPESYEGQLVEMDTLYKASGTWPLDGANASVYVTNRAKTDTLQMYIDLDTDIDGTTEPKFPVNVVGVISQYKSAAPFNAGYELMPRYKTDITPIIVDGVDNANGLPTVYELSNNYPNPFNPSTQIRFALPQASMAKLVVYDMLGREVRTIVNRMLNAGYYNETWNGLNNQGARVSSGMYIYRIEAGTFKQSKKMMLLK